MMDTEIKKWYILSATDGIAALERQFELLTVSRVRQGEEPVEYFLPICLEQTTLFGEPNMRRKKLIGNYIFIRDTYRHIIAIKETIQSLWLLPHPDNLPGERRFMTISDSDMEMFKSIATAYANQLPCYPVDMIDLEEGDKVEIVGGPFNGVRGTLQCSQGRNGGKVLMAIGNLFLVATPDIKPQYIRILQFGKGNRHPYRQFEAHLPRALQALEHHFGSSAGKKSLTDGLTNEDRAAMAVFTGRFEELQPATVNIASQHATLMLMSYTALQDSSKAARWLHRCKELLPRVKSDTQQAWQLAFMYAVTGDGSLLRKAQSITQSWVVAANDHKRSLITRTLNQFITVHSHQGDTIG